MRPLKTNDIMIQTTTRLASFIILAFSIYLLLAGHNAPGGGFIGGLMTASALVLIYLAFDAKTIKKFFVIDFPKLIGAGLLVAAGMGTITMLLGYPFLTQFFTYVHVPILGNMELTTAMVFDIGVYLTVVGTAITIIVTIAGDDE